MNVSIAINFEFNPPEIPDDIIDNKTRMCSLLLQAREAYKKNMMQHFEDTYPFIDTDALEFYAMALETSLTNPEEIEKAVTPEAILKRVMMMQQEIGQRMETAVILDNILEILTRLRQGLEK
ncbi:hypothetical protein [Leptospira noguchii]|uniref:hypothetical protein n=1 Tax=Leptospira noguchii TaxID=28182 RepID=UPI0007743BAC|nr:hypothetical protein [Leptospira noguchii]